MTMATHKAKLLFMLFQQSLLFFLLLSHTVLLVAVLAQGYCDNAKVVLSGGEEHTFTENSVKGNWSQINLFVKADSSLEGLTVIMRGVGGIEYTAWFPMEEECFPDEDMWYQVLTFAGIKNSTAIFGFETKICRKECEREKVPRSLQQLSVVPQGASSWRQNFPERDCATAYLEGMIFSGKRPTCFDPPAPMATMTIIVIVIVTVVVSALVAGLAAFLLGKKFIKKRDPHYSPAANQPSESGSGQTPSAAAAAAAAADGDDE